MLSMKKMKNTVQEDLIDVVGIKNMYKNKWINSSFLFTHYASINVIDGEKMTF